MLDFHGLEKKFSHNAYDVMTSDAFQDIFINFAKKTNSNPQELFDQYLMCMTGKPVGGYTDEDVIACQASALRNEYLSVSDISLINKQK
jgi:hypothetical protein